MCELADASLVTAMSATPHSGGWFCTAGFGRVPPINLNELLDIEDLLNVRS